MEDQHSGPATLPRDFRYSEPQRDAPSTPEPFSESMDLQTPFPPKPRLRLKKRCASSHLTAPTEQFLASVAAADVPIPSIEEPADFDMDGSGSFSPEPAQIDGGALLMPRSRGRLFSPPRTPAPGAVLSRSPPRYPSWTVDSSISSSVESTPDPDDASSRPSTSHSTQTSASLFSHFSRNSYDDKLADPETEELEQATDKYVAQLGQPCDPQATIRAHDVMRNPRKALWTKAMSEHVWSVYRLYLGDPKVTPFTLAKNGLPPHGVLVRVAREAKRSWKGSRTSAKSGIAERKSGSSTPTADIAGAFIKWPHTNATTREHLRRLCKMRAMQGTKLMPRSPAPYPQVADRYLNRRSTPANHTPAWATQDMSMSLTLSTAESMQRQGPLAQLTGDAAEPVDQTDVRGRRLSQAFEEGPRDTESRRLGSPFSAQSYGPSSTMSLAAALGLGSPQPRRQTISSRRTLQSPVRMGRAGTIKRRNTQSSDTRKRPGLLPELFDQFSTMKPPADPFQATEFSSTNSAHRDELFIPRIPSEALFSSTTSTNAGPLLDVPREPVPRLGSPFSGTSSFSFPNRLHKMQSGSVDMGILSRPFATIQQGPETSTMAPQANLPGRLAYLDQRLREMRSRGPPRRSESPL